MANEQVLPLALSGAEIKKIAHDKLDRLMRSCHLNDEVAYGDGVYIKISLEIRAKDMGREVDAGGETEFATHKNSDGLPVVTPVDPEEFRGLEAADAMIEESIIDPTAARIQSNQEVPVKSTDKQGRDDVRTVKYRRDLVKK